jgi:hypothetical protein
MQSLNTYGADEMSDAEKAADAHVKSLRETYPEIYPTDLERARSNFLAGYAAAQQWRPIGTAPRDGSRVLVKVGVSWPMFASFRILDMDEPPREEDSHHYKKEWRAARGNIVIPTGWLPLPQSE